MKKNFVSLYFTDSKLQILQINRVGKVIQVASVDLPPDLVVGKKVKDINVLAKILKSTWKKLSIRERFVGVVIPEFVTFTKLLTVPKLTESELAEAVEWQIKEFMPYGFSDTILDWKIVKTSEKEYEILAVVAQKEVVLSFVKACELAGVLPVIVLTPSLALSAVIDKDFVGRIVVYKNKKEGVVLLTLGKTVLGNAVLSAGSSAEVLKTAKRILNHYGDVKVTELLVGGLGLSPELVSQLGEELKLPVKNLDLKITGLEKEVVQEYLVVGAMQFVEAFEPADTLTINLLPPSLVLRYRNAQRRIQFWGITLFTTLFVWLCFFSVLGTFLFLNNKESLLKEKSQEDNSAVKERQEAVAKVKQINTVADKVYKIESSVVYPETIFNDIKNALPEGVVIISYEFDLEAGEIVVEGIASDRSKLITFKQNLEKNETVENVVIPISSLEVENNVEFSLAYYYIPIASRQVVKRLPGK